MPEPIVLRIVQDLQATLLAISVAGGFHYDVAAAAVKLDPNQDVEALVSDAAPLLRPFLIVEVNPDAFVYQPAMRVRVTTPITIYAVHESDPTDDASWLRTWSRLCADVEQAIAADITRGGLAVDTRIVSSAFRMFGGQQVWAVVNTELIVLRGYGAPNG